MTLGMIPKVLFWAQSRNIFTSIEKMFRDCAQSDFKNFILSKFGIDPE